LLFTAVVRCGSHLHDVARQVRLYSEHPVDTEGAVSVAAATTLLLSPLTKRVRALSALAMRQLPGWLCSRLRSCLLFFSATQAVYERAMKACEEAQKLIAALAGGGSKDESKAASSSS
jgi:hypothetical protein